MFDLFDYASLNKVVEANASIYQSGDPFPHIFFDEIINTELLCEAVRSFPSPESIEWFSYKNPLEIKLAQNTLELLPRVFKLILWELNSGPFVRAIEKLTGIQGLIPDPDYVGGGLHQIQRGGKLDIHADFNFHRKLGLDRRVNVIIYLNRGWVEEYGGHLELWDSKMSYCKKILPIFNRLVCFNTTDSSYHGHPDPLTCPEGWTRKSLALYYYSVGRPEAEKSASHSTLYQARPGDDSSLNELRRKRALGRI